MTKVFNPPPSWPTPARGWVPPAGWHPDPAWGPAPAGWPFWVEPDQAAHGQVDPSPQRIFISYRRSDCQPQANGLYDGLTHRLTSSKVFMDIDSIPPGVEFEQHIRDEIKICDLVLVLIGDNWLDRTGLGRTRRIDQPNDFVRLEIESALASPRVQLLPVLVEGASMPQVIDLPESIRALARINAIELSDRRWTSDLERLSRTVDRIREDTEARVQKERREKYENYPPPVRPPVQVNRRPPEPTPQFVDRPTSHPRAGVEGNLDAPTAWPVLAQQRYPAGHLRPASLVPAHPGGVAQTRTPVTGWVMIFVPMLTFGLANFVPALWSITQRRDDLLFRRKMIIFSIVVGVAGWAGLFVTGTSPTNAAGEVAGAQSDIGITIWFVALIVATVVAVLTRKPKALPAGAAEELARRRQRDEYRRLVNRDVNLARTMGVGRPDLKRNFDDGGLLDLNALSFEALTTFGQMSATEARQVVEARERRGRLSAVEDISAGAELQEPFVMRLKQLAVFL